MLKSTIAVDLPSAVADRSRTAVEWIQSLFGAKLDLRSNQEELTISALSLVAGMVEGFQAAGVNDVICFVVDKKVVYLDTREVPDDLPLVLEAAEQKRILEKPFSEMHLVLSHKEAGLHVLIDVRIRNRVLLGQEEMHVDLSGRIDELKIQTGELAQDYRARIEAFMQQGGRTDGHRAALDQLTGRIADKLNLALVGARAQAQPATVQVIRPDSPQLARLRRLAFGSGVQAPRYRPVPTFQRSGAYADPFFYYYYDPYYDYMSWVMLDSMLHHNYWHSRDIGIVDGGGGYVGTGADPGAATDGWWGRDAVGLDGFGGVSVDSSIPDASVEGSISGWDSSVSGGDGSDAGGGWGGGDTSFSSDSSSSSSCSSGSSCSSSSCGGGGCGGGGGD